MSKSEIKLRHNADRIILDVLDALTDAGIGNKSENQNEEGDVEYNFQANDNYSYFLTAMKKLQEMYDFEIQTYTDTEDNTHNISLTFSAQAKNIMEGR